MVAASASASACDSAAVAAAAAALMLLPAILPLQVWSDRSNDHQGRRRWFLKPFEWQVLGLEGTMVELGMLRDGSRKAYTVALVRSRVLDQ